MASNNFYNQFDEVNRTRWQTIESILDAHSSVSDFVPTKQELEAARTLAFLRRRALAKERKSSQASQDSRDTLASLVPHVTGGQDAIGPEGDMPKCTETASPSTVLTAPDDASPSVGLEYSAAVLYDGIADGGSSPIKFTKVQETLERLFESKSHPLRRWSSLTDYQPSLETEEPNQALTFLPGSPSEARRLRRSQRLRAAGAPIPPAGAPQRPILPRKARSLLDNRRTTRQLRSHKAL